MEPISIPVETDFDVRQAISDIQFFYNLARHKGERVVITISMEKKDGKIPAMSMLQQIQNS